MRLTFVFLIALPTLVTVLFLAFAQTSWYDRWRKETWERHLSQSLGFVVSIERVEELAPNHLLFHEATLQHPETGDEVVRLQRIDALHADRRWGIWISRVTVSGDHLAYFWRTLHDWYVCRPQQSGGKMLVRVDDLSIQGRFPLPGIVDLHCDIEPTPDQFVASLRYHHASDPQDEWIVAELERHHSTVVPTTEMQLQTGSLHVPLTFLYQPLPGLQSLGDLATFQGSIAVGYNAAGYYQVRQSGLIRAIRFDEIANHTPHLLTGFGDVEFRELIMENGCLVRADGDVTSRDRGGYIGRELIQAACDPQALGVRIYKSIFDQLPARVRYDTLGMQFSIDKNGLKLSGMLKPLEATMEGPNNRALMLGESQTLLFEPQANTIPLSGLVALFQLGHMDRESSDAHPFSKWMASRLPWPALPASSPSSIRSASPHSETAEARTDLLKQNQTSHRFR